MEVLQDTYKDTKIGRIPKDWELSKVGEICEVKGGKRVPKGHKLVDVKTDFPYIRDKPFSQAS